MYSSNIVNFQESTTILNACTKKSGNLLNVPRKSKVLLRERMNVLSRQRKKPNYVRRDVAIKSKQSCFAVEELG